ncbi:MAG: O-antigen ligase family protein, partial [Litorilinea sp.]
DARPGRLTAYAGGEYDPPHHEHTHPRARRASQLANVVHQLTARKGLWPLGPMLLVLAGLWFGAGMWLPAQSFPGQWLPITPPRLAATPIHAGIIPTTPSAISDTPTVLTAGTVAPMHSAGLVYSPGWQVDAQGADPPEPADPWQTPAGVVEFTYAGRVLALALAQGDYWGYLYVTVDGEPANRLARIPDNVDSRGRLAGYTTLYAPDHTIPETGAPAPAWHVVHIEDAHAAREVRVEVWRSWGQVPLRGVAVDALPPPAWPSWPGVLLALLGIASLARTGIPFRIAVCPRVFGEVRRRAAHTRDWLRIGLGRAAYRLQNDLPASSLALLGTGTAGALCIALAAGQGIWWLSWLGLALLGLSAFLRPSYWLAAVAFALPFYYQTALPLLPQRAFGLLDVGLGLGLVVVMLHRLLLNPPTESARTTPRHARPNAIFLWSLIGWALVATVAALYAPQAWYEWRTVFLAAGLFWLLLRAGLPQPARNFADLWLVLGGWLAGGTLMAGLALLQYGSALLFPEGTTLWGAASLITAEGVSRVRGLYGSPNNLALYLDRTLLVTLGLALYLPTHAAGRWRAALWLATGIQLAALILTFSKGALLLAVPAGFATLWLGGLLILPRTRRARRPLWGLLGLAAVALLALVPFLGTERFRNLIDLSQGTGFLRLQLWRSALAMGWDHWLLGVGPDNFLYAFRSRYLLPAAWQEPNLNHPHNLLLDGWTRLGLPGLMLLLAWLGSGVWELWRGLKTRLDAAKPTDTARVERVAVQLALLAAATGGIAHGLIDVSYALPDLMLVWILLFYVGNALRQQGLQDASRGQGRQNAARGQG